MTTVNGNGRQLDGVDDPSRHHEDHRARRGRENEKCETTKARVATTAGRKAKSPNALAWCMQRQLEISLSILIVVLAANAASRPEAFLSTRWTPEPSYHLRDPFSRALFLSFRLPDSDLYYKGRDDAYFIAWWVVIFWFLREALMRWVLAPFARRQGIKERRNIIRFAEQGWSVIYYVIFWSLGLYIMQTSPYAWLNTSEFYIGYPHIAISGLTKFYYLAQTAFWIQQIIVINLEAKRKDYYQMFAHHIITTLLMALSYIQNWTRVGTAILCTMDVADILLSSAKLFKYSDMPRAADVLFAIFLVVWIATRHVAYGVIVYSVYAESSRYLPYEWRPRDGYFHSRTAMNIFRGLLTALQVLLCIWLGMILRVVWKMVVGGASAEDTRSDDEGEEEDQEDEEEEEEDEEHAEHDEHDEHDEAKGLEQDEKMKNGVFSETKTNGVCSETKTNGHSGIAVDAEPKSSINGHSHGNGHAANGVTKRANGHVNPPRP